jgi:hypothetical protein
MEQRILTDKNQFPTDEIIFFHIGKSKPVWLSLFETIHATYPDIEKEWRYYNDGKSWLMKATRKKKTVFWLSIAKDAFRTTFYFTDKAEEAVMASRISESLKEQFRDGKHYGRLRGLTIYYASDKDVQDAMALIEIKIKMK